MGQQEPLTKYIWILPVDDTRYNKVGHLISDLVMKNEMDFVPFSNFPFESIVFFFSVSLSNRPVILHFEFNFIKQKQKTILYPFFVNSPSGPANSHSHWILFSLKKNPFFSYYKCRVKHNNNNNNKIYEHTSVFYYLLLRSGHPLNEFIQMKKKNWILRFLNEQ